MRVRHSETCAGGRPYPKNQVVTDKQLAAVNLKGHRFHPEWNYTISPTPTDTTESPR